MILPCQLTFRDFSPSPSLGDLIRKKVDKLDHLFGAIIGCRVVIEAPHRKHHHGRHYHVRIDITVPNGELVVGRDPPEKAAHEDAYAAIEDAFDDAERVLHEHARRVRRDVKRHDGVSRARVKKLFADEGYGFLETRDGREIYFHRNSVLHHGFNRLRIGEEVRYAEEDGDKGPQASTVAVR
ncbi:HPF/RaiA family ribosome-associated protein [Pendulispora albinea]|uniref:HPF/RaiA family ribosome-associated protein n=1 Tax=Pendulispora albinea TaxID=2741071 RepID=A0ABZ2LTD9_9BACT